MPSDHYLLYGLIVACEVGFWVILLLALVIRYLPRNEPLSRALLFCLPLVDLFLLTFTAMDLRRGAAASFAHGLAAAYIGFTLAFGALALSTYHWVFEADLIQRSGDPSNADLFVGTALVILTFEATRRILGLALPIVCGLFLLYEIGRAHV